MCPDVLQFNKVRYNFFFDVSLTVNLSITLDNDQQLLLYYSSCLEV